ncbi:aldo/keto reductase [Streptomyces sp. NPDC059994]|uniref:aldo/keto reductase n=1 Tax=Streptomyces sp. NPDC059994 TaxID=3347029 RepID=UPI0036B68635
MTPPGGTITIAGRTVSRLGLGTMRLAGRDSWHMPADRVGPSMVLLEAVRVHGITHIDTADAYGPHTVEELIHDCLASARLDTELLIATKVGMVRPGPNMWAPLGRPAYLRAAVEGSLRRLGVDQLDLCYLHRNDPEVPFLDQVGALAELRSEGKIAHIGLSKVGPAEIDRATEVIPVAAVQNKLSLEVQDDISTVEHCRKLGIPFVAYSPLGTGVLAERGEAGKALRWLLDLGPHVIPMPGTSNPRHLSELVDSLAAG